VLCVPHRCFIIRPNLSPQYVKTCLFIRLFLCFILFPRCRRFFGVFFFLRSTSTDLRRLQYFSLPGAPFLFFFSRNQCFWSRWPPRPPAKICWQRSLVSMVLMLSLPPRLLLGSFLTGFYTRTFFPPNFSSIPFLLFSVRHLTSTFPPPKTFPL